MPGNEVSMAGLASPETCHLTRPHILGLAIGAIGDFLTRLEPDYSLHITSLLHQCHWTREPFLALCKGVVALGTHDEKVHHLELKQLGAMLQEFGYLDVLSRWIGVSRRMIVRKNHGTGIGEKSHLEALSR